MCVTGRFGQDERPPTKKRNKHGVEWCILVLSLQAVLQFHEESLMRKLTITLATAALVFGAMALPASAQNEHRGAASIHALKNATPIVKQAACNGMTGGCGWAPAGSVPALRAAAAACPAGR